MIRFTHNLQIIIMIAVLAVSFFITYDFFITHISYERELFLGFTVVVIALAIVKILLKIQLFSFINKNKEKLEYSDPINPIGKKRILTYDLLTWTFILTLALFQTKLFGMSDKLTLAYYLALVLDVVFWVAFNNKFQSALISGQLMLFSSRSQTISLKNIKLMEKRFGDYYIVYNSNKFRLLNSDLISEKMTKKISVFFEKTT